MFKSEQLCEFCFSLGIADSVTFSHFFLAFHAYDHPFAVLAITIVNISNYFISLLMECHQFAYIAVVIRKLQQYASVSTSFYCHIATMMQKTDEIPTIMYISICIVMYALFVCFNACTHYQVLSPCYRRNGDGGLEEHDQQPSTPHR